MKKWPFARLKVDQWPVEDRAAWMRARSSAGNLALGRGPSRRWRPATWRLTEDGYGFWLGWLAAMDELDPQSAPEAKLNAESLMAYVVAMEECGLADQTRASRIQAIRDALRVIMPLYDSGWISLGATRMRTCAKGSRDIQARMRPAAEIYQLGLHLMRAAESNGIPRWKRPIWFRDGLMIAFLICCPLRLGDFSSIKLGEHLTKRGAAWWLKLGTGQTKQKRVFECKWPPMLVPQLELYLEKHRPALALAGRLDGSLPEELWLSGNGVALDLGGAGQVIEIRTRKAFGKHINPHLFRHIAATEIATFAPHDVSDAAAVLGHSSLEVTREHYIHASAIHAVRAHQRLVVGMMKAVER